MNGSISLSTIIVITTIIAGSAGLSSLLFADNSMFVYNINDIGYSEALSSFDSTTLNPFSVIGYDWHIEITGNETKWVETAEVIETWEERNVTDGKEQTVIKTKVETLKITAKSLADRTVDECIKMGVDVGGDPDCLEYKRVVYDVPNTLPVKDKTEVTKDTLTKQVDISAKEYYSYRLNATEDDYYKLGTASITVTRYDVSDLTKALVYNITAENNFTHLNVTDNDLVLYMPFDVANTSAKKTYDYTYNNNDGTIVGAHYIDSGKIGGAYVFNSDTEYLDTNWILNLASYHDFSFSVWAKHSTGTMDSHNCLLCSRSSASNDPYLYMMMYNTDATCNDGELYFGMRDGGNGDVDVLCSDSSWEDTDWHNFVFVYDDINNLMKIYVDGKLDGSGATTVASDDAINLVDKTMFIGSNNNEGTPAFGYDGTIDEAIWFNKTLTLAEVNALYNQTHSLFHPRGEQTFQFQNFTQDGTMNRVNVTIQAQMYNSTELNATLWEASVGNNTGYIEDDRSVMAYWHFDSNALDYQNNNWYPYQNNGTLVGGVENVSGRFANAFFLNGSNAYIQVPIHTSLNFGGNTEDFTLSAWVKREDPSRSEYLFDIRDANDDGYYFVFLGNALWGGLNAKDVTGSATSVSDTNWHHVVLAIDRDSTGQVYVDGKADGTADDVSGISMTIASDLYIGRRSYDTNYPFNGTIDEVMIFNKTLSAEEIKSLYITGSTDHANNGVGINWTESSDGELRFTNTGGAFYLANFTIPTDTNYILPDINFYSNINNSYSPVLMNDINYTIYNVTEGAPPDNPPTITAGNITVCIPHNASAQFNATDDNGVDTFYLNETNGFTINRTGYFINDTELAVGTYTRIVFVNDTANNTVNDTITITVYDVPKLYIVSPLNNTNNYPINDYVQVIMNNSITEMTMINYTLFSDINGTWTPTSELTTSNDTVYTHINFTGMFGVNTIIDRVYTLGVYGCGVGCGCVWSDNYTFSNFDNGTYNQTFYDSTKKAIIGNITQLIQFEDTVGYSGTDSDRLIAQTFTTGNKPVTLINISLQVRTYGTIPSPVYLELRNVTSGVVDSTYSYRILWDVSGVPNSVAGEWANISIYYNYVNNTEYSIVINNQDATSDDVGWRAKNNNPYATGTGWYSFDGGLTWQDPGSGGLDFNFRVFGIEQPLYTSGVKTIPNEITSGTIYNVTGLDNGLRVRVNLDGEWSNYVTLTSGFQPIFVTNGAQWYYEVSGFNQTNQFSMINFSIKVNNPPSSVNITWPANNTVTIEECINITYTNATDPDGDYTYFEINISDNSDFSYSNYSFRTANLTYWYCLPAGNWSIRVRAFDGSMSYPRLYSNWSHYVSVEINLPTRPNITISLNISALQWLKWDVNVSDETPSSSWYAYVEHNETGELIYNLTYGWYNRTIKTSIGLEDNEPYRITLVACDTFSQCSEMNTSAVTKVGGGGTDLYVLPLAMLILAIISFYIALHLEFGLEFMQSIFIVLGIFLVLTSFFLGFGLLDALNQTTMAQLFETMSLAMLILTFAMIVYIIMSFVFAVIKRTAEQKRMAR